MDVEVEYVLSCSFTVLLNYTDAVCIRGFFDCRRDLFGYNVDLAKVFLWDVEDVDVVGFGNHKRMPHVQRSYVEENHGRFVFVDGAYWRLPTDYSAKYTRFIKRQINHSGL